MFSCVSHGRACNIKNRLTFHTLPRYIGIAIVTTTRNDADWHQMLCSWIALPSAGGRRRLRVAPTSSPTLQCTNQKTDDSTVFGNAIKSLDPHVLAAFTHRSCC